MLVEVIDQINLDNVIKEVETLDYHNHERYNLQGVKDKLDPLYTLAGKLSNNTEAWKRDDYKNLPHTFGDFIHLIFDLPYINSIIEEYGLYNSALMNRNPGSCYSYHTDHGKRIHIPIYTNDKNFFIIEDNVYRLPADGSVYLIDTTKIHTFVNASADKRLHLIGYTL
jgi:hypothetical protein